MTLFRKLVIGVIDLFMLFIVIRAFYLDDGTTDVFGLFVLGSIAFFIAYNLYGLLVYFLFRQIQTRHATIEIGFLFLMLLPFYFLWRYLH